VDEKLRYLDAPPDSEVEPPVRTGIQQLPLGALNWPDFERLCLRLIRTFAGVEHAQLYGISGQAQQGIDIYARRAGGGAGYGVYQCRRVAHFTAAEISGVVDDFLAGGWRDRATDLVLCTSADLTRTELAEAVESANERLRAVGKRFLPLDVGRLSEELKQHPRLVLDFFGRGWVEAFVPDALAEVANRLDPGQLRGLRGALRTFYTNVFAVQDAAEILGLTEEDAWHRFVVPDVTEMREVADAMDRFGPRSADTVREAGPGSSRRGSAARRVEQRMPLDEWLANSPRHVLLADAGGGKSSALRFIALDLLSDEPRLGDVLQRWDTVVPVWVPFGFWVARVSTHSTTSLTDAVRLWLASYDEERLWPLLEDGLRDGRVLLLVDGLDEWTDAAAAGECFRHLEVFVRQRDVPVLATSRPAAFEQLGPPPRGWSRGSLVGLSADQQSAIVDALQSAAAAGFLEAISRSGELEALAVTPLLLLVLLRLYETGQPLPRNRFAAFAAVCDFLLEDHPRRRGVVGETTRPAGDVKAALAAIAFRLHVSGDSVISEADAGRASADYFTDSTAGPGLSAGEARMAAVDVVADARMRLGLLVRAGPATVAFPHRSLQEYLAAFHLSGQAPEVRHAAVAEHAPEPAWYQTVLNLIALASDTETADALIEIVEENRTPLEQLLLQPLLAEIAAARFGSPPVAHRIAAQMIDLIETGPDSSLRTDVLIRVGNALGDVEQFRRRMPSWLPSLDQNRSRIFLAMRHWPEDPQTRETIWRGLFDEDAATARAAARTFAERYQTDGDAHERLVGQLREPMDATARAAALEGFASKWPDDPDTKGLMGRAHVSADPNLRLVAHSWRIAHDEQTSDDLADLMTLASERGNIDYDRQHDVRTALKDGWPRDETIKAAALRSVRDRSTRELELDTAQWLLLAAYPGDTDVISWCVDQIERVEHPFLGLHFDAWRLLAENFRDEPSLVAALDVWIPRQEFHEPEVSYASMVGRTDVAKTTMLERLGASSFPHWYAAALLNGWGMNDGDVATCLTAAALGEPDLAGCIASFIPQILGDPDQSQRRLGELVSAERNQRPGLALDALGQMDAMSNETVDVALARESVWSMLDQEVWHALIRHAPNHPGVRELAKNCYDDELHSVAAVAYAYADDAEMRALVRQHAVPLSSQARLRLSERLRAGSGDSASTVAATSRFLQEVDPLAASTQAQAYVRVADDRDALVNRLADAVRALGPTHERTRQTALTALLELGRADVFADARERNRPDDSVDVSLTDFLTPNAVLADAVVRHWDELEATVGDVVQRFSRRGDVTTTWDVLALVADQSPRVRELALEFVDSRSGLTANLLRLYARMRPRSAELADLCFIALRGGRPEFGQRGGLVVAGAEVLGASFAEDSAMLDRLAAEDLPMSSLVMALAEGWPYSDMLSRAREEANRRGLEAPWEVGLRIQVAVGRVERALEVLRHLIDVLVWNPRYEDRAVGIIVRRLRSDRAFVSALADAIATEEQPSEVASFARLLAVAGVLDRAGRESLRAKAEHFIVGDRAGEIGFDLIAARHRPVGLSLVDAIYGAAA
jgi:hypothetical protein